MRNPHRKPQRPENGRPQGRSSLFKKQPRPGLSEGRVLAARRLRLSD